MKCLYVTWSWPPNKQVSALPNQLTCFGGFKFCVKEQEGKPVWTGNKHSVALHLTKYLSPLGAGRVETELKKSSHKMPQWQKSSYKITNPYDSFYSFGFSGPLLTLIFVFSASNLYFFAPGLEPTSSFYINNQTASKEGIASYPLKNPIKLADVGYTIKY